MLRGEFEEERKKERSAKDYGSGNYYMVPRRQEDLEFFSTVERKTREMVKKRFGITSTSEWEAYTVTIVTLNAACAVLAAKMRANFWKPDTLEFYDMLTIASSNRKNEAADKTMNINCSFVPGKAIELIETDPDNFWTKPKMHAAEAFLPENQEGFPFNLKELQIIGKNAAGTLSQSHGIVVKDKYIPSILAITYVFLEHCFKYLIHATINREDKRLTRVTYELGTLIRLNGREADDHLISIELGPGPGSKKIIKNDNNEGESAVE